MSQKQTGVGWLRRVLRSLFGAPFKELPPEYGDPVPPDLRAFEEKANDAQHQPLREPAPTNGHTAHGKPHGA